MAARRTGPLIGLLVLGTVVLGARLYQVQALEHGIWAEEARKLLRSGALLPYERGALLDAEGAPLVRDSTRYQVELEYRDFRRGAPLAQVAHARSALVLRDVTLHEARANLVPWARELVQLSPRGLWSFARGAELNVGDVHIAETSEPAAERRPARAGDLGFYARALLQLDRAELRALRSVETDRNYRGTYLEWTAAHRGRTVDEELRAQEVRWQASVDDLAFLSQRLEQDAGRTSSGALERWIDELEDWRVAVDGAAAGRLFREVAGFPAGRLAPEVLLGWLDLDWLAREMRWDRARLEEFARQERRAWLASWRNGWALPRLLAELRVERAAPLDADRALSTLLAVFGTGTLARALDGDPVDWRQLERLAVLDDLERVLALDAPRGFAPESARPTWQSQAFRTRAALLEGERRWDLLAELSGPRAAALEAAFVEELGEASFQSNFASNLAGLWRVALGGETRHRASNRARIQDAALGLLGALEDEFQTLVAARFAELAALPAPAARSDGRLAFGPDRLDRLNERARHLQKDYGSRRATVADGPSYEVVYLLTREPDRYPGFRVRPTREREAAEQAADAPIPAAELLGLVSGVNAEQVQRQRSDAARFRVLRAKTNRTADETLELRSLMGELLFAGETRGVSGIEGYADAVLRGRNGYRERLGLEDVFGRGAHAIQLAPVENGRDVQLTLHMDLQRAAERTINRPEPPPPSLPGDPAWLAAPVGAIVLLDREGRVLAAASAPNASYPAAVDAEGQRAQTLERTLRQPGFQPVGSVFKPFVALYSLAHRTSPGLQHVCEIPPGEDHAEWGGVRCHARFGHGPVDLARALEVSCNTYFARLADDLGADAMKELANAVGFGLATGVEDLGQSHIKLETVPNILGYAPREDLARQLRRAANGLSILDGTPMQVARAFHALATGQLHDLQLIERVGNQRLVPPPPTALPYNRATLDEVRRYLVRVTAGVEGSAREALAPEEIGWVVAAKTGSADLASRRTGELGLDEDPRQPKHTWIAGWLPAERPALVFCVFVNDTLATASQSAAWIARQLLLEPDVIRYLEEHGTPRDPFARERAPAPSRPSSPAPSTADGGVR